MRSGIITCSSRSRAVELKGDVIWMLVQIMELLEHKSIFTAGYKCILHVHAAVEECECIQLDARIDMKTKQKLTVKACFKDRLNQQCKHGASRHSACF